MIKSKRILAELAKGTALNAAALAGVTGIPELAVHRTLWRLKALGFIESQPTTYAISGAGIQRIYKQPVTIEKKRERERIRSQSKRDAAKNRPRFIPNSVFQLGGIAA